MLVVTAETVVETPIVNNPSAVLAGVPKAKLFLLFVVPAIAAVASAAVGSTTTNDARFSPIACEELKGVVPRPADTIALPSPSALADDEAVALVIREVPVANALGSAVPVVLRVVVADANPGRPAAAPLNTDPISPPVAEAVTLRLPLPVFVPVAVTVAVPPLPDVWPVPLAAPPVPPVALAVTPPVLLPANEPLADALALPPAPPLAVLSVPKDVPHLYRRSQSLKR